MQSASDTASSHLWEWCEAGIELAMMWRSATDAGRTGAQRLSPSAVILGHGCSKMYHEHGDTPAASSTRLLATPKRTVRSFSFKSS